MRRQRHGAEVPPHDGGSKRHDDTARHATARSRAVWLSASRISQAIIPRNSRPIASVGSSIGLFTAGRNDAREHVAQKEQAEHQQQVSQHVLVGRDARVVGMTRSTGVASAEYRKVLDEHDRQAESARTHIVSTPNRTAAPGLTSLRMISAISGSPRLLNHRLNAMNGKSDQATLTRTVGDETGQQPIVREYLPPVQPSIEDRLPSAGDHQE